MQTLIEVGRINFKSPNQSNNLLPNFSKAKTEKVKQIFRPQRMKNLLPLVEESKEEGLDVQLRRQRKRKKLQNFKRKMKSSEV